MEEAQAVREPRAAGAPHASDAARCAVEPVDRSSGRSDCRFELEHSWAGFVGARAAIRNLRKGAPWRSAPHHRVQFVGDEPWSVSAIAQGAPERNISVVVGRQRRREGAPRGCTPRLFIYRRRITLYISTHRSRHRRGVSQAVRWLKSPRAKSTDCSLLTGILDCGDARIAAGIEARHALDSRDARRSIADSAWTPEKWQRRRRKPARHITSAKRQPWRSLTTMSSHYVSIIDLHG